MSLTPRTSITLQNVMLDLDAHSPDPSTVGTIFARTLARWETVLSQGASEDDSETASASLNDSLNELPPHVLCRGRAVKVTEHVSRIIDRGPFETWYLRPGAFGGMTRPSAPSKPRRPVRLKAGQVQRRAMFTKPGRQCHWVTKTSVIDFILSVVTPEKWATRVRDHLGLQHYRAPKELVEIIYPEDALTSAHVAAPTFFEGSCNYVYRSPVDDPRKLDPWGRAVDLEFPQEDHPDKLAPEVVHEAIEFTHEFTYRHLGALKGSRRCAPAKVHHPRPWRRDDPGHLREYTS